MNTQETSVQVPPEAPEASKWRKVVAAAALGAAVIAGAAVLGGAGYVAHELHEFKQTDLPPVFDPADSSVGY